MLFDAIAAHEFFDHPNDLIGVGMEGIEAQFIFDEKHNRNAGSQSHCEAAHIDGSKAWIPTECANRYFQVGDEHGRIPDQFFCEAVGTESKYLPAVPAASGSDTVPLDAVVKGFFEISGWSLPIIMQEPGQEDCTYSGWSIW